MQCVDLSTSIEPSVSAFGLIPQSASLTLKGSLTMSRAISSYSWVTINPLDELNQSNRVTPRNRLWE